jgi:predicted nucleic acid-binding protein
VGGFVKAIADASSLIVLARQDTLWLLERVLGRVALVPGVETETVVQGKAKGYADAERIEAAIVSGKLAVIAPTAAEKRLATHMGERTPALSRTDCTTLACAKERGLTLIMEEQRGRNVAVAHDITYVTIQVLPLQGFIAEQLSFAECDDLLARMGQAMRTDKAILAVLRAASSEIERLRSAQGEGPA